MKAAWTIIVGVSFLNFMAILAVLGWLLNTGRLDQRRLEEVRELFAETTAQRDARVEAERKAGEAEAAQLRTAAVENGDPASADLQLARHQERAQADAERLQRLRAEVSDLRDAVSRERRLLDEERSAFVSESEAFKEMRRQIAVLEGSEQFRKALVVLEQLKAGEAKAALEAMLADGKQDEVVGYLDAMEDRARTKVIAEFIKDADAPLAAELLEELRVRGIGDLALGDPVP